MTSKSNEKIDEEFFKNKGEIKKYINYINQLLNKGLSNNQCKIIEKDLNLITKSKFYDNEIRLLILALAVQISQRKDRSKYAV